MSIKGRGVRRLMENSILNFHFVFRNTSLTIRAYIRHQPYVSSLFEINSSEDLYFLRESGTPPNLTQTPFSKFRFFLDLKSTKESGRSSLVSEILLLGGVSNIFKDAALLINCSNYIYSRWQKLCEGTKGLRRKVLTFLLLTPICHINYRLNRGIVDTER